MTTVTDLLSAMNSVWSLLTALILVSVCQSQSVDLSNALRVEPVDISPEWVEQLQQQLEEVKRDRAGSQKIPFSSFWKKLFQVLEAHSFPTAVATNISQKCMEDSQIYLKSQATHLWAMQSKSSSSNIVISSNEVLYDCNKLL